jgi:actin-related protein
LIRNIIILYKNKYLKMVEGSDENTVVVLDNGSGMMKAGFAGEEAPQCVFPAIVGRPKNQSAMMGTNQKQEYIGDDAAQKRGILNLAYPIAAGIVESWEDMEKVWHHTFYNELRVSPNEIKGVLLTEAPRQPKANREKMVQIMFETFEVQNIYVAIQAVMSLYSAGRTTGLVTDSGDGVTHTVPVFEGFSLPHAVERMEIAGRVLTGYLQKLLLEAGHNFTSAAELEIVREIKEELCYVAQDYAAEKEQCTKNAEQDKQYTLPDKAVITVPGSVRIGAPELIYQPNLNGMSCKSIDALAWASVSASDIDVRRELCKNIIMSGGSTMYEGMADRLKQELVTRAPSGAEIRVVAAADRKYAVWKGGSTLASLSTFSSSWVTKEDYEEHGAAVIHRKCN